MSGDLYNAGAEGLFPCFFKPGKQIKTTRLIPTGKQTAVLLSFGQKGNFYFFPPLFLYTFREAEPRKEQLAGTETPPCPDFPHTKLGRPPPRRHFAPLTRLAPRTHPLCHAARRQNHFINYRGENNPRKAAPAAPADRSTRVAARPGVGGLTPLTAAGPGPAAARGRFVAPGCEEVNVSHGRGGAWAGGQRLGGGEERRRALPLLLYYYYYYIYIYFCPRYNDKRCS